MYLLHYLIMTDGTATVRIENGASAGRTFNITADGARIGRSSKNDIILSDPLLSRFHCRLFIKDGGLWVTDLGSANETLLNDRPITEVPAHKGSCITIGDTVLRVENDARLVDSTHPAVDLGLGGYHPHNKVLKGKKRLPLYTMAATVLILMIASLWWKRPSPPPPPVVPATAAPALRAVAAPPELNLYYEKVEASPQNIFRYAMTIEAPDELSIIIDDVANNRRLARSKTIGRDVIMDLIDTIRNSGFTSLDPLYRGVAPGILEERSLTVILGRDAYSVRVSNRVAPEIFENLSSKLESVGKVELGLWAIQYSVEQLTSMSEQAMLQGKKLSSEREIAPGNLAAAISSLNEAEWLLESIEPRPTFYPEILAVRNDAVETLNSRYEEINFRAERAIRLRDWENAADELRLLLENIPDREDPRHQAARKNLIEVEARQGPRR